MKNKSIGLYKILYESNSKKYKIILHNKNSLEKFYFYCSANYAKNIAMASEGVNSLDLSQYELFLNLLSLLKIKISSILIRTCNSSLYGEIKLIIDNKVHILNSSIHDSIIIGLKSLCMINIESCLLKNDNIGKKTFFDDNIIEKRSVVSEIDKLKKILIECINDEQYDSAALIRDRIKKLALEK